MLSPEANRNANTGIIMKKGCVRTIGWISHIGLLCVMLSGCSSTPPSFGGAPNDCKPYLTSVNQPQLGQANMGQSLDSHRCYREESDSPVPPPENRTRGTTTISADELPDGNFVGIALSGGGSRAANFSAAVLYYLKNAGIFDPKDSAIISSVSGGSLPAAYFAIYGDAGLADIKEKMAQDFQNIWIGRWFYPGNAIRYWFSTVTRTDLMAGVLDDSLFDGKWIRYDELKPGIPKIVINATSAQQLNFSFTNEQFDTLNSNLGNFPLAYAVATSAAFPAVFQSVSLQDYSGQHVDQLGQPSNPPSYVHLFDGGPSDNLGVDEIQKSVLAVGKTKRLTEDNCLIIIVDSYPDVPEDDPDVRDTRGLFGRVAADQNFMWAMDTLLAQRRADSLRELDYWSLQSLTPATGGDQGDVFKVRNLTTGKPVAEEIQPIGSIPVWVARIQQSANRCTIWHLTFDRLAQPGLISQLPAEMGQKSQRLAQITNSAPTLFHLKPYGKLDTAGVQDALFCAADILVTQDKAAQSRLPSFIKQGMASGGTPDTHGNPCDRSFDY
jgi:predicted acylesterase/phospholipase RssA